MLEGWGYEPEWELWLNSEARERYSVVSVVVPDPAHFYHVNDDSRLMYILRYFLEEARGLKEPEFMGTFDWKVLEVSTLAGMYGSCDVGTPSVLLTVFHRASVFDI